MKKAAVAISAAVCAVFAISGLTACNENDKSEFTWTGLEEITIAAGDSNGVMEGLTVKYGDKDVTSSLTILTLDDDEAELTAAGANLDDFDDFSYNIPGAYSVYYKATYEDKYEVKMREVTVTQQHNVSNGDFTEVNNNGFYNWKLDTPGGAATMSKVDENGKQKPKFEISGLGNAWYAVQYMNKANLKQNETYKITVRAKSTNGKSMAFGFEDVGNGYAMLKGLSAFTVGTEYADYVSYYTANNDYTDAKAVLYLGYMLEEDTDKVYDITIDSIKIEKIETCPNVEFKGLDRLSFKIGMDDEAFNEFIANPRGGVTAKQGDTDLTSKIKVVGEVAKNPMEGNNFQLAYVVENENGPTAIAYRTVNVGPAKEHSYSLINGDFEKNLKFWTIDINAEKPGPNGAEMKWVEGDDKEGAVQITVNDASSPDWGIQFRQDVNLEKGVHYLVKVRAKASVNRDGIIELNGNTKYTMKLTNEYKDFEFAYIAPETKGMRFGFLLGGGGSENVGSVITIDSVEITLDEDQTNYKDYEMANPEFNYGIKNWGYEGAVTYTTGKDGDDGYVKAHIDGGSAADWSIQLRQDGKVFDGSKTYKVIVRAKASAESKVKVEVTGDVGKWTHFTFTTEVKTYEFEFKPDEDGKTYKNTRVGMLLGELAAGTEVTIYQFEVVEVTAE